MGYFKNHILPEFGKRQIDSITYFDCKQFTTKLTKKLKSSRKILFYFSRILKEAVQMELISKNPMVGVELPPEKQNQFEYENEVFKENYYNRDEIETTMKIYTHVTRQSLANSTKNYLNYIKSDSNE